MMSDDHTDILVNRVIDGRDTAADWQALESLGSQDPEVWRTLALAQRDHRAIAAGVRHAGDLAQRVAVPGIGAVRGHAPSRARRTSAWAGWAAAARRARGSGGGGRSGDVDRPSLRVQEGEAADDARVPRDLEPLVLYLHQQPHPRPLARRGPREEQWHFRLWHTCRVGESG